MRFLADQAIYKITIDNLRTGDMIFEPLKNSDCNGHRMRIGTIVTCLFTPFAKGSFGRRNQIQSTGGISHKEFWEEMENKASIDRKKRISGMKAA
jgi:hypothetical protein